MPLVTHEPGGQQADGPKAARWIIRIDSGEPTSGARTTQAFRPGAAGPEAEGTLRRSFGDSGGNDNSFDRRGVGMGPDGELVAEMGRQLFTALFSGQLTRVWAMAVDDFRAVGAVELIIDSTDRDVHELPWELLYDPTLLRGHIGLTPGWSITRRVRTLDGPVATRDPVADRDGLQILVIGDAPTGGGAAAAALQAIGAEIDLVTPAGDGELVEWIGRRRYDLVHLAVVGDRGRGGRRELLLPGPGVVLSVEAVRRGLAGHPEPPALLVLAGGYTDGVAGDLSDQLPAVVGMRSRMTDDGVVAFLSRVYRELGAGAGIAAALATARVDQHRVSPTTGADEWALPVAFLANGSGPLLDRAQPAATQVYEMPSLAMASAGSGADDAGAPPAADGDRERDQILFDMMQANLAALTEQWGDLAGAPHLVRAQHDSLTAEVAQLRGRLGDTP